MDQEAFNQSLFLTARLVERGAHYALVFAREHKAVMLHRLGRKAESLAVYRSLLPEILSPEERQRIQANIEALAKESG